MRKRIVPIAKWAWRHRVLVSLFITACVFATEFALLKIPEAHAAYTIANSARFNDDDSAYLSKTLTTPMDATKWTYSVWLKRPPDASADHVLFAAGASTDDAIKFDNGDTLQWFLNNAASGRLITSGLFRDPAKWYHLVFVFDSGNATANSRMRIYQDGVEITAFGTRVNPSSGYSNKFNANSIAHAIGRYGSTASQYYDGYMSDVYLVDGQALDPTSFGATDANGYWRPKSYSGTYGTNGFHLDFSNGASLGTDASGTGNNWTVNNLDTTDQVIDTPTNSFPVFSQISGGTGFTYTNGGLKVTAATADQKTVSQFAPVSSGKWYFETTIVAQGGSRGLDIGVAKGVPESYTVSTNSHAISTWWAWASLAGLFNGQGDGSPTSAGVTLAVNDVVGVAVDVDAGKIWWSKNCTWILSGDPASGTNAQYTNLAGVPILLVTNSANTNTNTGSWNFGQGGTTTIAYDSASGGYFYCTPPSGFKALSTANLPEPAIAVPKNYFDAKTYSGTAAYQNITGLNVQPDLVWLKDRTGANAHGLFNSVWGGISDYLSSNSTAATTTDVNSLSAFLSDGFSLGATSTIWKVRLNGISGGADNNHFASELQFLENGSVISTSYSSLTATGGADDSDAGEWVDGNTASAAFGGDGLPTKADQSIIWTFSSAKAPTSFKIYTDTGGGYAARTYPTEVYVSQDGGSTYSLVASGTLSPGVGGNATLSWSSAAFNTNGNNYISWLWKESPTSGFDIVTYTGTGVARTISHSLGVAPKFVIIKPRDAADHWVVFTNIVDGSDDYLYLETTAAKTDESGAQAFTLGASSITIDTWSNINDVGKSYVAYLFAEVPGFSKFGSYTGNGSADGPFVYTGFKPRYVMVKRTDSADEWWIWDTARSPFNVADDYLRPNSSQLEAADSNRYIDLLSNGFKLRTSHASTNASGGTYIYAAFADVPFYYSAQPAASVVVSNAAVTFLMGMTF